MQADVTDGLQNWDIQGGHRRKGAGFDSLIKEKIGREVESPLIVYSTIREGEEILVEDYSILLYVWDLPHHQTGAGARNSMTSRN